MILDASGRKIDSPDETKLKEIVRAELAAFGEWQKTLNEGKGITTHGLDAIARSCVVSLFRSLPIGSDMNYLDHFLQALNTELERVAQAKKAEAKIAASLMQGTDGTRQ